MSESALGGETPLIHQDRIDIPDRNAPKEERDKYYEALDRTFPGLEQVFINRLLEPMREAFKYSEDIPVMAAVVKPVTYKEAQENFPGYHFFYGKENAVKRQNGITPDDERGMVVLSSETNTSKATQRSGYHAEINAIDEAQEALRDDELPEDAIILSTCEPCSMCLGKTWWAGGRKIIYAASYDDHKGKSMVLNGKEKSLRTEYDGYHAEDEFKRKGQEATVYGGYMVEEVMDRMYPHPNADLLKKHRDWIEKLDI